MGVYQSFVRVFTWVFKQGPGEGGVEFWKGLCGKGWAKDVERCKDLYRMCNGFSGLLTGFIKA